MARDLSSLPVLKTREDTLACLRADPSDRLLLIGHNLSADEFDRHGLATRTDDSIFVIVSLRRSGMMTLDDLVQLRRRRPDFYSNFPLPEELAIVEPAIARELADLAEEGHPARPIAGVWCWSDMWVLPDHPYAETDDDIARCIAGDGWQFDPARQHEVAARKGRCELKMQGKA